MTRLEFAPVLAFLVAAAGREMPDGQSEVYYELLSDLPAAAVLVAVKRCVAESRYPGFPPVGAIRAAASEVGSPEAIPWPAAWRLACDAARRFGAARPTRPTAEAEALASLPPCVAAAARAVGWGVICDASEGDCDTLRAQFRDSYSLVNGRGDRERRLPGPLRAGVARLADGVGALPGPQEQGD